MKSRFYLLHVVGGVEPAIVGGYRTAGERDEAAKELHQTIPVEDVVFQLDVDKYGIPSAYWYSAGFFAE